MAFPTTAGEENGQSLYFDKVARWEIRDNGAFEKVYHAGLDIVCYITGEMGKWENIYI